MLAVGSFDARADAHVSVVLRLDQLILPQVPVLLVPIVERAFPLLLASQVVVKALRANVQMIQLISR